MRKIAFTIVAVIAIVGIGIAWYIFNYAGVDIYVPLYAEYCEQCHGSDMEGSELGPALVDTDLSAGDNVAALQNSIRNAHLSLVSPPFSNSLTDDQIKGLAIFIGERRLGQRFAEFRFDRDVQIPTDIQVSEAHRFYIEPFVTGLDPLLFSIEPLPDGSWLVTEKERGLSLISKEGVQSAPISGTPETGSSIDIMGIQYGSGWLLDVAMHPDYANNGWIYLHYTHICAEECDSSLMSATMNRMERGRIVDGNWVDVQTIWQSPAEFYTATPDTGAGGRIAFDDAGHVFLSMGIKSTEGMSDTAAQDLKKPWGKIHRVHDDGTIPADNPFVNGVSGDGGAALPSIWTYGHRSPQGLEWHPVRKRAWNSEMGPRGGDEINELLPGRNYGWPYHSLGLEYIGETVQRHLPKSIEFDASDVEQTLVDITPSPAISSFVFYDGDQFPNWQGDVLIGSLKGSSLFRMAFDGNKLTHRETVVKDLARIRDIEIGYDGLVYLLLESEAGGSIVRLRPAEQN